MFWVAPIRQQSSLLNLEMNRGSLSLITFLENSESGEYMTEVKISHSFGIDGLIAWYEYRHLGAIMICDGENQVISI
jgi:hypothetical protein